MARIRYLKPDFFKDEDIKELPFEARLLYQGLWCFADREGRGEDRPERLKVEIFPYDDVDVEKLLELLAKPKKYGKKPFINRYITDKQRFFEIVEWKKHQKPHNTEKLSTIPAFNGYLTVKEPLVNNDLRDAHYIDKGNGKGNGEEKEKGVERFNDFWNAYPKQVGMQMAILTYRATIKNDKDFDDLMAALKNYMASPEFKKGMIKNGDRWIEDWRGWIPKKAMKPIVKAEPIQTARFVQPSAEDRAKLDALTSGIGKI